MTAARRRPRPLGEEIFTRLRQDILRGDLRPGERLIEEKMADRFAASRTPVREAFLRLERDGLIVRRARGGFIIGQVDLRDMDEIMDMRAVLEGHAAARAARRRSDGLVERLKSILDRYESALEKDEVKAMVALNTEFHEALYQASESKRLLRMIGDLQDHFYRIRKHILGLDGMGRQSHEDHVRMVEAIDAGDDRTAEEVVREHINRGRAVLKEQAEI